MAWKKQNARESSGGKESENYLFNVWCKRNQDFKTVLRFESSAVMALQEGSDAYLVSMLQLCWKFFCWLDIFDMNVLDFCNSLQQQKIDGVKSDCSSCYNESVTKHSNILVITNNVLPVTIFGVGNWRYLTKYSRKPSSRWANIEKTHKN